MGFGADQYLDRNVRPAEIRKDFFKWLFDEGQHKGIPSPAR